MRTIRTYLNLAEAEVARTMLEAAGIEAEVLDELAASLVTPTMTGGVRLQVPDADVERALEILRSAPSDGTPISVTETTPWPQTSPVQPQQPPRGSPWFRLFAVAGLCAVGISAGWVFSPAGIVVVLGLAGAGIFMLWREREPDRVVEGSIPSSENAQEPRADSESVASLPRPFSIRSNLVFAMVAVAIFVWQDWPIRRDGVISRLGYPADSALRVVERHMELYEATARFGFAEWLIYIGPPSERQQTPKRCEKILRDAIERMEVIIAGAVNDPGESSRMASLRKDLCALHCHLVVLLAETGRRDEALRELKRAEPCLGSGSDAVRMLRTIYFPGTTLPFDKRISDLGFDFKSAWSDHRVAARLARLQQGSHDADLFENVITTRGQQWRALSLTTSSALLLASAIGLACLPRLLRRLRQPKTGTRPTEFGAWSMREGVGILLRGYVFGETSLWALVSFGGWPLAYLFWDLSSLVRALPTLLLLNRLTCGLGQRPPAEFFGVCMRSSVLVDHVRTALSVVALSTFSWLVTERVTLAFGGQVSWCESLDDASLFSAGFERALLLTDRIMWGPLMEEIIFRGLLFGTLRGRLNFLPAALLSSIVFAAVHHSSIASFLSIGLTGFWLALAYERSRSLVSCVVAHMLVNFLFFTWQIWFLG